MSENRVLRRILELKRGNNTSRQAKEKCLVRGCVIGVLFTKSFWEVNNLSARKDIPVFCGNGTLIALNIIEYDITSIIFHYGVDKSPQRDPILSHINPVHVLISLRPVLKLSFHQRLGLLLHFFLSCFRIALSSPRALHTACLILHGLPTLNSIRRRMQIMKLVIVHFSEVFCYLHFCKSRYSVNTHWETKLKRIYSSDK